MCPASSALLIMLNPILSLTEEQGSIISNLAATRATASFSTTLFRYTIGVLPA
jgi:hypothetical protein